MRSSSLATTIFHENSPIKASISDPLISQSNEKLLLTTTSTINSKSSFWTVTDREPEWYKLSIPISACLSNTTRDTVPACREFIQPSKSKRQDQIGQPK